MKRLIDYYLLKWKNDPYRMSLLLRGARQVGKTHAVRELGKSFENFVEINLELNARARLVFEKDPNPERIIRELDGLTKKTITPGKTLLFIDEIQAVPEALLSLRYFYELMPELHVIAAGSLLDFAIEKVGIPVGRVQSFYMYPLSFMEFLAALGETALIKEIFLHTLEDEMSLALDDKLKTLVGEYLAVGGMPLAVARWAENKDPNGCVAVHQAILSAYRQDFGKYATTAQVKYVELIFEHVPIQIGHKFKYTLIEGEYRKRELAPALDLLVLAGVCNKVYYTSGKGVPLGALMDPLDYKIIFLDVGLSQSALDLDLAEWLIDPATQFVNKGMLVEEFVGQEILAYADPSRKRNLFYWHQKDPTKQAEVDYLLQIKNQIIPIEIKGGDGRTLKSLRVFMEAYASPYGIRFSAHNYSEYNNIHSYPLYAVGQVMSYDENCKKAIMSLTE
jgi:predicted AAA+ superfamily ATPase